MNEFRYRPDCPMRGAPCKQDGCAWFCGEEKKCAIALLPSTLDWRTRCAVTKPYEKEETEE